MHQSKKLSRQKISPNVAVYSANSDGSFGSHIGDSYGVSNRNFDYSVEVQKGRTYYVVVSNSVGGKYADVPFNASLTAYPAGWFQKEDKWYYVKDNAFVKYD